MHQPLPKLLFATCITLTASLLLIGCSPAAPAPTNQVKLTDQANENTQTNVLKPTTAPVATPQTSPSSTTSSSVLGKSTMKQLSDFEPIVGTEVTMTTNKGPIVFTLFRDKAPLTTLNFLTLAKAGFYNGILFHRVIPDFMAQFGDPLTRDPSKQAMWGTGGAGYSIPDEFSPDLKHDSEGIVSMANSGPNTGSSQIFITYEPTPWLDGKHAVFGKVTSGMDVLRQLKNGDQITSVTFK